MSGFSIGKSMRSVMNSSIDDCPGPGQYNDSVNDSVIKNCKTNHRNYTFARSIRKEGYSEMNQREEVGPGKYLDTSYKSAGPYPKFMTSTLKTEPPVTSLGPGAYQPPSPDKTQNKKPNYSFGFRYEVSENLSPLPGPGSYNQSYIENKDTLVRSLNKSFPKEAKLKMKYNYTPGPGAYEDQFKTVKSNIQYQIGKSKKQNSRTIVSVPGPGYYAVPQLKIGNGVTFKGRKETEPIRLNHNDTLPVLTKEDLRVITSFKKTSFSFGKGGRFKTEGYLNNKLPGPGQYNIASTFKIKYQKNKNGEEYGA
eukprot:Mrub_05342.p1 GENE.Mrub_05342~~Mrub_05342.p1  ORF type:complete len:308 (-),score=60.44 Mrub_05342:26-949(-)